MNYSSNLKTTGQVELPKWRARVLLGLMMLILLILLMRSFYLQIIHNDFLQHQGDARYVRVIDIGAHRGKITDRNGEALAISTQVESVWASPADVEATPKQINQLAQIVGMSATEVKSRLSDTSRDFVYIKRQMSPDLAKKAMDVGIAGVALRREYRRYYPSAETASHVLGFTDLDDNGQEGVEFAWQSLLGGKNGSQRVIKDRRGQIIEDVASVRVPKSGQDLILSLDSGIQFTAFKEIKSAVETHHAKAGSIVVLDAKTGELLALANWPSYNPNNREKQNLAVIRNHAIADMFEPGSTMKPFTIAAALESGVIRQNSMIDTMGGVLTIGGRKIHDTHPENMLSVAQVIQKSSNVGAAKIALLMPAKTFWQSLSDSGFGEPTGSNFPGEASGKLRDYKSWRPIEQATMSYGNGIAVNLLQLARAYTVFANEGELKPITMLKQEVPAIGAIVYSAATAQAVRDMLETVVKPGGTAPLAQVVGYRVAGKTGTSHKLENGRYVDKYIASFVGMAPASNPRLIVAVMLNEPSGKEYYGGQVAAPAFSNVMSSALRQLNVPNDAPLNNVLQPPAEILKEDT